jgi:hypothetical protein
MIVTEANNSAFSLHSNLFGEDCYDLCLCTQLEGKTLKWLNCYKVRTWKDSKEKTTQFI